LGGYDAGRHEEHRASAAPLGQHFAQEGQHCGIGEMKHHGARDEEDQRAIPEEYPDALRFGTLVAVVCAAGEFVVNLGGLDETQRENCGEGEGRNEEEDAAVGNEVAEQSHGHSGNYVPC